MQEYRSRRHILVEILGDVRKPHTLKCPAVIGTETKLACIKQASFFNVPLDYIQNNFLKYFACCKQEANRNFERILGPYRISLTL
jgi:hypothetical protein